MSSTFGPHGLGPDIMLPNYINWFLGVQLALLAWFVFHIVGACITYSVVATARNKTVDTSESKRHTSEALRSLVDAIVDPVLALFGYVVQLFAFMAANAGRVVLVIFFCILSLALVNYQQELVVAIDSSYSAAYPWLIKPLQTVLTGAVVIYDILVGFHNAVHQFIYQFLWASFKSLLSCGGYFASLFDNIGAAATAIGDLVIAASNWLTADLVGQLDITPALAQVRLMAYDFLLRAQCLCEGNRGLIAVATTGLIDAQTTVVDQTINYGLNSLLSIPQVVIASVIASVRTNTYTAPNTDYVVNQFEGFLSSLAPLLNQLTVNLVTFIENLLNQDSLGIAKVNWVPPPFWSIFSQLGIVILEAVRVVARSMVNVNDFFITGPASRPAKYALLDASAMFTQANILPDTVFITNFNALLPGNVLLPWSKAASALLKVPIAAAQVLYELVLRVLIGYSLPGQPNVFDITQYPLCVVTTQDETGMFENIWASVWDTTTRVNLFINAVDAFTSALGNAIAPYYPPVSPILQFGINWIMEMYYALFIKAGYLINTIILFKPPLAACVESIGHAARVSGDNFVKSIPDLFTFFLDIRQAQQAENAHLLCEERMTHNFILSGSLKAYFFASEISNIAYSDGLPITCDFYASHLCPSYTLAYADLNNNMLCNLADELTQLYINVLTTTRLTSSYGEAKVVTILACLIAPSDSTTCSNSQGSSLQQSVTMVGKQLNDIQTLVVKSANLFVSLFSPLFDLCYQSFYGPNSAMSGAQATEAYNQQLNPSPSDILSYVAIRHNGAGSCGGATSSEACALMGEHCQWMGSAGGGCQVNSNTHLAFQTYPLEAAFVTLIVAVADNFLFYPQYLAYLNAQRMASAFTFTDFSVAGVAEMIGNVFTNMAEDQYFVILTGVRLGTMAIRDNIVALVEFIRAFIYVLSRGVLPQQFVTFEKVMSELINFAEALVALLVNEGFTMLMQFGYIVQDFMGIVADPSNLGSYMVDMFHRVMTILTDAIQLFETLILNLPGISELCPLIAMILNDILKPLVAPILNGIVDAINIIIGILDYIFGAGIDQLPNLDITQDLVCNPQGQAPRPYEPTLCSTISDCTGSTAYCAIMHPNQCSDPTYNTYTGTFRYTEMWDQPCACTGTTSGNFYCNYASGYCEAGISSFGDPLMSCPVASPADLRSQLQTMTANPFSEDTDYWQAMCWILPVYLCKPTGGGTLSTQGMTACITNMLNTRQVQGPFLCRSFCSPSAFNTDNQLYNDPAGIFGCVCLIGVGVGSGTGAPQYVPDFAAVGRRMLGAYSNETLQSFAFVDSYMSGSYGTSTLPASASGATACVSDDHCSKPAASCRRRDGSTAPCEVCPMRLSQPGFSGFKCASAQCTCASPPPPREFELPPPRWAGYSKCAIIGRAYGNRTDLSALEYVELRDCTNLYRVGEFIVVATGAPLDPSVAYDTGEMVRMFSTMVGGFILERAYGDVSHETLRQAMVDAQVNPDIYFSLRRPALASVERIAAEFPKAAEMATTTGVFSYKFTQVLRSAPGSKRIGESLSMVAEGARTIVAQASRASESVSTDIADYLRKSAKRTVPEAEPVVVHVSAVTAGARRLNTLAPTTCGLLVSATSTAQAILSNLKIQFTYNVPHAICIFLGRSNCPQTWEKHVESTTPPPPRPPPYKAPSASGASSSTVYVQPAYPNLKTLQGDILEGVGSLSGYNLKAKLDSIVQTVLNKSPANPTVVGEAAGAVNGLLACDYTQSVMCLKRKRTLLNGIITLFLGVVLSNIGMKFIGFDFTFAVNIFFAVMFVPVLLYIVYSVPFGCTLLPPPVLPVCLMDDLLPLFGGIFSPIIAWPPGLIINATRTATSSGGSFGSPKTTYTLNKTQVVDCVATTKLYDAGHYLLWGAEAFLPNWRRQIPLITTLMSTMATDYAFLTTYQGVPAKVLKGGTYMACAGIMFPVVVPGLALIVLFAVFGLGLLHIALVCIKNLLRALSSFGSAATSYFEEAKNELSDDEDDDDV